MLKVGFIGWRGMVGSVLMERMKAENAFKGFESLFFTTSQVGQKGPDLGFDIPLLKDAYDTDLLMGMDIIVTCQGSGHTEKVYPELRKNNWKGYWIDASSKLRMVDDSVIVLDPINKNVITDALSNGILNFIGGNCTVSLMLMAIGGLFQNNCVEWVSSMTYQAASGAGAKNLKELIAQMTNIGLTAKEYLNNPATSALELDKKVLNTMHNSSFPIENFGAPLAASLIPWIDSAMENGQTKEEWKGMAETNKILNTKNPIPIDGQCVRIGAMRCHSQAFTIKLTQDISLSEINNMIKGSNDWVKLVPNVKEDTLKDLTPSAVSGTLTVPVGRIRKMQMGPKFLTAFSVGDQLLWGAAEPVWRALKIVLDYKNS